MTTHYTPLCTTDQMFAAAGFVSRNWGETGYRLGCENAAFGQKAVFVVRHADGSEFRILVDRWGNATLPAQCARGTIGCAETRLTHDTCRLVAKSAS